MAAQCRCVCFGSLAQRSEVSRTTITTLLDAMPAEALKVFDINLRQNYYDRAVIEASLRRCRILKINDEETHVVSRIFALGIDDEQQICLHLKRLFDLQAVILTCGTNGSHVIHDDGISTLLTPRVEVADTVGAGDSFTAQASAPPYSPAAHCATPTRSQSPRRHTSVRSTGPCLACRARSQT